MISYEKDFYGWCLEQKKAIEAKDISAMDFTNLSEEIESLGKQWKRELINRLAILLLHLIKWQHSPSDTREYHKNSWLSSIRCQQREVPKFIEENPSLKPILEECFKKAYERAKEEACYEGKFIEDDVPISCIYAIEDVLKLGWLPETKL